MTAKRGTISTGAGALLGYFETIASELAEIGFTGERARICTRMALSVVLAVTLAQLAHLEDTWWAAISGLMTSQATGPASVRRSILRVSGTAAGAMLGYVAVGVVAYDHVALCLFLFVCGTVGILGMTVSPHGYAWMLSGLTANLVVMMTMTDPTAAPFIAFDRFAQVTLGSASALLMATLMASDNPEKVPPAPGWTDLLGARWPAVMHAVRCGITVAIVPVIWTSFDLPSLTQMAITVTAVMAVPVASDDAATLTDVIMGRSIQRFIGCFGGGVLGLLCLTMPLTLYPLWLTILFAGIWVCMYIATSTRGVGYAGLQGGIVFVLTLVQGPGPPSSILPGIDRLVGIVGGLAVLLLVSLLIWPSPHRDKRG